MLFESKIRSGRLRALNHLKKVAKAGTKHGRPRFWLGPQYMVLRPYGFDRAA